MTENQWLNCADPDHLLKWLQKSKRHRPTLRKLGLFACACAARLGDRIRDDFTARGLTLAERMAEGTATPEELQVFRRESLDLGHRGEYAHIAVWAVRVLEPNVKWSSPEGSARSVAGYVAEVLGNSEPGQQCQLLREVINPYRSVGVNPPWIGWNDGTLPKIAQAIYDERAFDRMPILADALEDAGCDNADVLSHCREPGEHVRGCWVVDLLLGKS